MNTRSKPVVRPFQLKLLGYGNCYYIERVARLEAALARKPRLFQLDLVGIGEIPADIALLIRSILRQRSPNTRVITRARSSLRNGSVLVWLLGDTRLIRDDAQIYFRRAELTEDGVPAQEVWREGKVRLWQADAEVEPEEGDHAMMLQRINEFLPVKDLAGRLIAAPVLREFGLVDNEDVDRFLAAAFARKPDPVPEPVRRPAKSRAKSVSRIPRTR